MLTNEAKLKQFGGIYLQNSYFEIAKYKVVD